MSWTLTLSNSSRLSTAIPSCWQSSAIPCCWQSQNLCCNAVSSWQTSSLGSSLGPYIVGSNSDLFTLHQSPNPTIILAILKSCWMLTGALRSKILDLILEITSTPQFDLRERRNLPKMLRWKILFYFTLLISIQQEWPCHSHETKKGKLMMHKTFHVILFQNWEQTDLVLRFEHICCGTEQSFKTVIAQRVNDSIGQNNGYHWCNAI